MLVLRFYDDLSVEQTALVLACSEGTVKSHTHRALTRLRELLGENGDGVGDDAGHGERARLALPALPLEDRS